MALRTDLRHGGQFSRSQEESRGEERWVNRTSGSLIGIAGSLRGYSENNIICCSEVSGSCGCGCTVSVSIHKKQCTVCFQWVGDVGSVRSE